MRTRTPVRPLVLAVVSLAFVAAGCGGGGSSGTTTTSGGAAASGGTLRIAIGSEPPSLDPGLATDTTSAFVVLNTNTPIVISARRPPEGARAARAGCCEKNITLHLRAT
jgi:oligopeptide transport system substrate-binding protein